MSEVLGATESVCPECLARIPACRVSEGDDIYLEKNCPQHGTFRTILWRGVRSYSSWVRPKTPAYPQHPITAVDRGCPFDCGLCPDHRQHTCTGLLEVTQRCDLRCSVCFADAGRTVQRDPDLTVIESWYKALLPGGQCNIQLSGGEPCLRDDLPDIAALGRSLGFPFIQVNTNGLRLARELVFAERLKNAGVSSVFLQFDGVDDSIYSTLRGRPLMDQKKRAIEVCDQTGIGVVLVPTLVPGINSHQIGDIIEFALEHAPTVRGVHFQPVSYFGRYPQPPDDQARLTLPEIIQAVESQTKGRVQADTLKPSGCENARCSFHGNFVLMPDGELKPWTTNPRQPCCTPESGAAGAVSTRRFVAKYWAAPPVDKLLPMSQSPSLGGWDTFIDRIKTHTFCISGMAFQDAWTLDLERLKDCCIHTVSPDGRIIPFCAYNLTSREGVSLYRNGTAQE